MAGIFGSRRRPDCTDVCVDYPTAESNAMRLLEARDHIHQADRIIRAFLTEQSGLLRDVRNVEAEDVLLEVLSALGTAPAGAEVSVIPGRST